MSAAVLEIENLSKSFGGVHAVRDCSFAVAQGQVLGLIGPNGAGKSTVVDLVSGFGRPDSGSVLLGRRQFGRESLWRCLTRARRLRRAEEPDRAQARAILDRFGLTDLTNSRAGTLS